MLQIWEQGKVQRFEECFFFSDAFSAAAKILAHLQVSQLYVIFNAADRMSSGQLKFGTEFW